MRLRHALVLLSCTPFTVLEAQGASASAPTAASGTPPTVTTQSFGVPSLLQALHAVNDSVVWAVGNSGVVLRTVNGGAQWDRKATPAGDSLHYRDVHATSADTAWILAIGNGTASRIYHTTDGGASWALQFMNRDTSAFYDCFAFGSRRNAVVFGDASGTGSDARTNMLRTTDGATWSAIAQASVPKPLPGEGAFAASGQCVVNADSATVYVATGAPGARLFRSRDAGRTWSAENTPFVRGTAAGLTGMSFTSAMRGIAVGADINRLRNDTSSTVVGVTTDGGRSWTMRKRPALPGALAGVTWVPAVGAEVAVVSSYGGSSWTVDAGRTWTTLGTDVTAGITSAGRRVWLGGRGAVYLVEWRTP